MKMKMIRPHKGRAYLEPDRRIAFLVQMGRKLFGMKVDEFLASVLLEALEDEKEALSGAYKEVEMALKRGEFARTNRKDKKSGIVNPEEPVEHTAIGEVSQSLRSEFDEFLKGRP